MPAQLSDQARNILKLIMNGFNTEEMLSQFSIEEIQDAARQALEVDAANRPPLPELNKKVSTNIRTYEVWTEKEDTLLRDLLQADTSINDIANELERHPMTVRRRIAQLGLD